MRDFNFFEPYLTKQNRLSKSQLVIYIPIFIVILALVITPIVNQLIIKKMKGQTMLVSAIVNSEELQEEMKKVSNKKKQIQELEDYYKTLESIDGEMIKIDIINDLFLQTITDRVPEEMFFQNINISQGSIQITGIAKNNASIAEFEHNLRELTYFENIFVSNISTSTGGYVFTISFQIKGGIDDETN